MMVKDKPNTIRLQRGTVHCTNALIPLQSIKRPMAPPFKSPIVTMTDADVDPTDNSIYKTYLKLDSCDKN